MSLREQIDAFLAGNAFAVVGASNNRAKYGNKVLRAYWQHGLKAFPVNPKEETVEGAAAYPSLAALPEPVDGVSIVTPPAVTERVLEEAAAAGITRVWMQPGAEVADWAERARRLGLEAIAEACVLVALGYREQ